MGAGIDDLVEVVGRDVGGHADRDPLRAVDEQVGEPGGEHRGLLHLPRVVVLEVDRVLPDPLEEVVGQLGEPALGVPGGAWRVVDAAEVALRVDEEMTHREVLPHADQGVVDRRVAVGVVVPHDVTDDLGALAVGRPGRDVVLEHRVDDPSLHRLQAIADVGQGPGDDHRHGVVDEALLHLVGDLDLGHALGWWVPCGHGSDVQEADVVGVLLDERLA